MMDTASKDVLQNSGLSSIDGDTRTSGRLGGNILLVVVVIVVVLGVVVEVVVIGTMGLPGLAVVAGVVLGRSGLGEDGLYAGISPHILSSFEPVCIILF